MRKITILMISLLLTVLSFAKEKDYSEYANPKAIINVAQVNKLIQDKDKNIVLIDTRPEALFALGHIPGAHNLYRSDVGADKGEYQFGGMRATKEKMEGKLSAIGVTKDSHILIYDAAGDEDAARLWWILDYYGFKNVSLIDGGLPSWKAADYDLERGFETKVAKTNFTLPSAGDKTQIATIDDVKNAIKTNSDQIIDARSNDEHYGKTIKKGAYRAGAIPHNNFIEWKNAVNYNGDKEFKSAKELKAIYGKFEGKNVIPYCQSGVRSAHTMFVLTQLLGYKHVRNYDGSWIEWSFNKNLAVENGAK